MTAVAVALQGADQFLFAHVLVLRIGQQQQGFGLFLGVGVFVDALHGRVDRYREWLDVVEVPSRTAATG